MTCCYWFHQQSWETVFQIRTSERLASHVHKDAEYSVISFQVFTFLLVAKGYEHRKNVKETFLFWQDYTRYYACD